MEEKRKKKLLFAGSVFIGLMFIFSYLGISSNAPAVASSSTTSSIQEQSFFAAGTANVVIAGYSSTAMLGINSNSPEVTNSVLGTLSALRNSGTIQNYISNGAEYEIVLGGISAYSLQQTLYSQLNSTNAITIMATANARLTGKSNLLVGSQEFAVPINGTYPLNFTPLIPINSIIGVTVRALLTQNALLYNNQVSISYKQ
ncbi:MAG: hypothetical protein KGH58_03940 [Candidatus Micrarchaeota archaeon]|nr:hypothetical protein [Candidatus Micrarchaeota archaeon]MDE1833542.1 hypothetical protein [Candidatus Micrarchaeota archaeon]